MESWGRWGCPLLEGKYEKSGFSGGYASLGSSRGGNGLNLKKALLRGSTDTDSAARQKGKSVEGSQSFVNERKLS